MRSFSPDVPRPSNVSVISGHFVEGPSYGTIRAAGTDDFLLMLTLSGRGRIGVVGDGGDYVCETGDLTLLRPGARHDYGTDRRAVGWEFVWAHFVPRPHYLAYLNTWPERAPGLIVLPLPTDGIDIRARVQAALLEMHRRAQSGLPRRDEFALNSLEEALLWCDTVNPRRSEARWDPRVGKAMEYLREHLPEPVGASDLARVAGLSTSRLSHLFREETGQTPQYFLETERIARAQQLLALTGKTVSAIAEDVGFENPFYFATRFKKRIGCSPREWRQRQNAAATD